MSGRTFYFTFGVGHKLVSVCDDLDYGIQATGQGGIPLAGRYVAVDDAPDETTARLAMMQVFGRAWSSVYRDEPAGQRLLMRLPATRRATAYIDTSQPPTFGPDPDYSANHGGA